VLEGVLGGGDLGVPPVGNVSGAVAADGEFEVDAAAAESALDVLSWCVLVAGVLVWGDVKTLDVVVSGDEASAVAVFGDLESRREGDGVFLVGETLLESWGHFE